MTDEEINRKFDVVADHLATLAVGQERLQESQARTERIIKLAVRAGLRERRARHEQDERINALIDAQTRTDATINRLAETVERLAKNGNGEK